AIGVASESIGQVQFVRQLKSILNDKHVRSQLSAAGINAVRRCEADRVARHLVASLYSFRNVEIEDVTWLGRLRNDPEVIALDLESNFVSEEASQNWVRSKIKHSHEFRVIENRAGQKMGAYLIEDLGEESRLKLSLFLLPGQRGFGLGTSFIEKICLKIGHQSMVACVFADIKSTNIMAQRAFKKAGFAPQTTLATDSGVAIRYRFDLKAESATDYSQTFASSFRRRAA
ncbi:MAG: GNAT family N-acetyltransferase, partial [Planctomycetota bacterium]